MTADFIIHGLPPDDWPGIPGVDWGMGSRVWINLTGVPFKAVVVGAVQAHNAFGWDISVRCCGMLYLVSPDQVTAIEERPGWS